MNRRTRVASIRRLSASALALLAVALAAPAEELDVLTLKNGRVLEGHYDAATKAFSFGGGIVGSVTVEPGDIVKKEKKHVSDTPVAAADPATAPPTAAPAAPADTDAQAKKAATSYKARRAQLEAQLKSSQDYERLYQANITKYENEQIDLPPKIQALAPRIDRARADYDNAQSRYTMALSDYDFWRNSNPTGLYRGSSVADARQQRDRAERAVKDLRDEENRLTRRLDQVAKDITDSRNKLQISIDKQGKIRDDLATLEMSQPP